MAEPTTGQPLSGDLTADRIVADIAAALDVPAAGLTAETDLFDAGLDSIRLMALIDLWRAAGAVRADFPTLASDPVVRVWIEVLQDTSR